MPMVPINILKLDSCCVYTDRFSFCNIAHTKYAGFVCVCVRKRKNPNLSGRNKSFDEVPEAFAAVVYRDDGDGKRAVTNRFDTHSR